MHSFFKHRRCQQGATLTFLCRNCAGPEGWKVQWKWEEGGRRGKEEMSKAGSFLWKLNNQSQLLESWITSLDLQMLPAMQGKNKTKTKLEKPRKSSDDCTKGFRILLWNMREDPDQQKNWHARESPQLSQWCTTQGRHNYLTNDRNGL